MHDILERDRTEEVMGIVWLMNKDGRQSSSTHTHTLTRALFVAAKSVPFLLQTKSRHKRVVQDNC